MEGEWERRREKERLKKEERRKTKGKSIDELSREKPTCFVSRIRGVTPQPPNKKAKQSASLEPVPDYVTYELCGLGSAT